jgi:hypothetical protein
MKTSEIIQIRRSCRTFNGLKIEKSAVESLSQAIQSLQPLFNDVEMPIIKIVDGDNLDGRLGTYGFINGARRFFVMAAGREPLQQVQAGFAFEQLILKATEMGIATCWLGGTFRSSMFAQGMPADLGHREISIVSPLGHATTKQRFAERMMRRVVKADRRKPFASLFTALASSSSSSSSAHPLDLESPIGRVLECVRLAPSSSNSQPWRARLVPAASASTEPANPVADGAEQPKTSVAVEFSCATNNRFSAIDMGIAYCHFLLASAEENLAWRIDHASLSTPLALRFLPA